MDNLTHSLTGLMLSRAGLNRVAPRATALLVLASNAPDADIITALGGSLTYLDHHRGISHAVIFSPVMAALVAGVMRLLLRQPLPWLRAIFVAWIGVLIHLALDSTNTYGIRLLLPFSPAMPHLDITNVVDVWIWAALLLAVAGPLLSRLVSSEIGAKPGTGRGAAIFALTFLLVYNAGRFILHERALATVDSHLHLGVRPKRVAAFPHFANPLEWVALAETDSAVVIQRLSLLFPYDPGAGEVHYFPQPTPALAAARQTETFRRFLNFSQFPFWKVTPIDDPEGAQQVQVLDLRFGDPSVPRFVSTATVDAAGRVIDHWYGFGPVRAR